MIVDTEGQRKIEKNIDDLVRGWANYVAGKWGVDEVAHLIAICNDADDIVRIIAGYTKHK